MKIIFLDIDGVLNSATYDSTRNYKDLTNIDESRLPLLQKLVNETSAKIVLSTTWRIHWNKNYALCDESGRYIVDSFTKYGIDIYDKTPNLGVMAERREEIVLWLNSCKDKIDSFVIIDDYPFGWGKLAKYLVKTEPRFRLGLEQEHIDKAISILNDENR